MFIIFKTVLIVLLSTLFKLSNCALINKFDSVRPLNSFNSVYPRSSSSSSSPSSTAFNNLSIKKEPLDLDYNQDSIARFEHPFNFKSNDDKRSDESLNKDFNGIDQLSNYQQLNNFPNRRMTRIRFLTGPSDQNDNQSNQQFNRQVRKQNDNLLMESSLRFSPSYTSAYVPPKRSYAPILRRNRLRNQFNQPAVQFYNQPWLNDQQSKRNSYDLSDYQSIEQLGLENQPNGLNGQPIKNRRSKKALSLFAHWKPLEPYLSGSSDLPLSFKTPVRKAHISPILRWG